ncbi:MULTISPECIES: type IV secretory system conjugative DNA transfer family protein [unclassified Streptomyces]|uniref:type IV secretory system conjugative DNA transfer family protein n=1 Tax=unclassified Streptomyces TaxID=2593676 RepID=UPI002254CD8E|nr:MULTISPECIES: type IV secretory system conjugative DNA transfer family protein [unclassified Streptomyces]WSP56456.1 type IV secretory system conjugative DNA transfer family protein [Streptomyces sp. NBC_01241]WSU22826.1 type IV secretory system conjugative DNA transfer family protein [Streptomyces sp. NBC_01108]MCX4788192.1 type IV secretory system conjugative DNA transfer family protein [Streptomyces sp. NBC_01221]MCX4796050.1 type IV secretory system conjugative DNA transfer family protei
MAGRGEVRTDGSTGAGSGGIPDGLLIGLLAFLLGLTLLAWTATGLAGLFAHGAWPEGVTLTETPLAMRQLVTTPHDLPAAWPNTPADELSGYGLFWGLFIGELMVLLVLTVFVLGVVARWRAVRARRRSERYGEEDGYRYGDENGSPVQSQDHKPRPEAHTPQRRQPQPTPEQHPHPHSHSHPEPTAPDPTPPPAPAPMPAPVEHTASATTLLPALPTLPSPRTPLVVYGPAATRRPTVVQAIQEADGPALVITSDPTVWSETKDARAKLGPVLVYDPGHLCDTPARLHWSPTAGCEQPDTAAARATALLAPVRPQARIDAATADTAETLLKCWLHAAAIDGRPFRQVHRWAIGGSAHEPVRLLRTHPKAASGLAGLLESALTAYPERREVAQELTVRAFAALSSVHIREACTPNRADSLALESFAREGGTLYVVGESIEDPRSGPGAMPLLTALASHVVEHGRRMAVRSTDGRLDPPMTLVLDDVAAVAPLPRLPELLSTGQAQGLPTLALLRSQEQARARWSQDLTTGPH